MKKFLLTFFLLCLLTSSARAASIYEYPSIAVLPYVNKGATSKNLSPKDASVVSDIVLEKLVDSGRFTLVEREVLLNVLNEIAMQSGGSFNETTIVKLGNLTGASFLVAGSITGLSTKKSGLSAGDSLKGKGSFNKMTVVANVTMRFIDVETGQIVMAASGTGESARTNAEFTLKRRIDEEYETTVTDDSGTEIPSDEMSSSFATRTITIGSDNISLVQVRNALYWAVEDMIYNKKYGVIAKLDGVAKRRKV